MSLEMRVNSEDELDAFALILTKTAPPRAVISLTGTLGAGKTRLVRGVAAAIGVDSKQVVSPTFVLCQTYRGQRTIHHLDAYRLSDDDEFLELGAEEMMEAEALTFIEWGERVMRCLPDDRLDITIEVPATDQDHSEQSARCVRLVGHGSSSRAWIERVIQASESD